MKATAKSLLQRVLKRVDTRVSEGMIISDPVEAPVGETDLYLRVWTMIDKGQGGAADMPASQRRLALDAMVRLAEQEPGHMRGLLAEAGALGHQHLRSLAMTLMCGERSHRRREAERHGIPA